MQVSEYSEGRKPLFKPLVVTKVKRGIKCPVDVVNCANTLAAAFQKLSHRLVGWVNVVFVWYQCSTTTFCKISVLSVARQRHCNNSSTIHALVIDC